MKWLALLGLVSCALPPPSAVTVPEGTVRADTPEQAAQVAAVLSATVPRVRALLPATRDVLPEVWVQDEPWAYAWLSQPADVHAFSITSMGRIHVPPESQDSERASTLAHECVHVLLDDSWEPLPAAVEEGLCERVASEVAPGARARTRGRWYSMVAASMGGLPIELHWPIHGTDRLVVGSVVDRGSISVPGVGIAEALVVDPEIHSSAIAAREIAARAIGYVVVERIVAERGFAGLHALALEATADGLDLVPVDTLLRAAGLGLDPQLWSALALAEIDAEGLREVVVQQAETLAPRVMSHAWSRPDPRRTPRESLEFADPWLALGGGGPDVEAPRVRLADIPEFVAAVEALPAAPGR